MVNRGRPKSGAEINRASIIGAAFDLLFAEGHQGLSMRALATRLNVTPMALYYHFSDRSALVLEMSESVYANVMIDFENSSASTREKLETLLTLYHQAVVQYPDLTVLIFSATGEFSSALQKINNTLIDLLNKSNLTRAKKNSWLDILVDFTHGSALSIAARKNEGKKIVAAQQVRYKSQLRELISCLY